MKKIFIALVAVVVVAASAFGAVTIKKSISEKSNLKINEKSSLSEIIEFYNRSVKNSKDYKDFNLDVNTSVQLDEISSSSTFLNEMLSAIMGYNVGDIRDETQNFSFKNGTDANHPEKTPRNTIQPADSYIESFNESFLLLKSVSCDKDYAMLSFEVKDETADLDRVVTAINPIIKGQVVSDKSAIAALAPNHSHFIDVGDIMSTVVDMLEVNDMVNASDNQKKESTASAGSKPISIDGGKCVIGNTEISAIADSNELLHSVIITVPVELKAGFNLMGNVIETSIRIMVVQTYTFIY
ncbi:hypothetical protein IMSAG250_00200 [Clostridiales bacterium]|nr:hypothetical protein IMSAG250_00200 [Clostridiales bacterium]